MEIQRSRLVLAALLSSFLAAAAGCGNPPTDTDGGTNTGDGSSQGDGARPPTDGSAVGECGSDMDGDGIPDSQEGAGDADGDGMPNIRDTDSDGDGRSDTLEANAGRPYNCRARPADTDSDGTPDFLDTDSDNNGIPDAQDFVGQGTAPATGWPANAVDTDMDGVPDYADLDDDGDMIPDTVEIAPGTPNSPNDEDRDGTPDYHDLDSDGDTVADRAEGTDDIDHDMAPSFRDQDSDGDGLSDTMEAGDMDVTTAPVECPRELNITTLSLMSFLNDGVPDFKDTDSDNDGLTDREEVANGTDRCNPDSDGDGQLDSAEVTWCRQNHRMNCATSHDVTIPDTDYYLILPNGGPVVPRQLEFGTNIRVADVFFIFDTTGSMSSVQRAVANTIAASGTGLVDSIRTVIPDTWFGVGHYDDFPTGGFGGGNDRALHPLCDGRPDSSTSPGCRGPLYGGITMQDPTHRMDVQAMAQAIPGGGGSDLPESANEALYQIITNEGLYDHSNPMACTGTIGVNPCWVLPTNCAEDRWGYPCFRNGSLAIVINYTDAAFHNGARDQMPASTTYYSPYTGISPAPHNFDQMVQAFQRRSARMISINGRTGGSQCEGRFYTNHAMVAGNGPCYDFRMGAEGTGSVDLDGNPLVYDLPTSSGSGGPPPTDLVTQVTSAVNTLATRVPIDITTATRNDTANPMMVDARMFIKQRIPACQVAPRNTMCWTEPPSIDHRAAVGTTDMTTFYRVIPGTRVRFVVSFQNDGVFPGDPGGVTLFHALIDVMGDGITRLDTRDVYILVPAAQGNIG